MVGAIRKEVIERRELKKETKLCVFNALVVHILFCMDVKPGWCKRDMRVGCRHGKLFVYEE